MANFQFTTNPYLTGPMGFVWETGETARHSDTLLMKASRPHTYSWAVAHPAPHGERWADVTLHASRKEAMKAAGAVGAVFQGSFSQPRDGLVVARGKVFPRW